MVGYNLTISHVDGDTVTMLHTEDKNALLPFLEQFDHEGSSIYLVARMDNEEVYAFLKPAEPSVK